MRKLQLSLIALIIIAAPALLAQGTTGCAALETQNFNAALQPASTTLPPNALANLFLTSSASGTAKLHVRSLGLGNDITSISLYQGNPASGGILLQTITDPVNGFAGGLFSRQLNMDPVLLSQIAANPSNYFWVITTTNGGTLTGQLGMAGGQTFTGTLSGANGGAPNGSGNFVFSLTPAGSGNYTLDYDVDTNGIGNDVSSMRLTAPGMSPVNLATNSTATNGRLTGTITLPVDVASRILCSPASFRLTTSTPAFANGAVSGIVGSGNEIFIPVAGSAHGANGTNWKTDLTLFNNSRFGAGNTTANAVVQFYPASGGAPLVASQTIAARGISNTRDISSNLFDNTGGLGGMRIVTSDNVIANARIYNDQSANGQGTFGQFVSGLARSKAISAGLIAGLATTIVATNSQASMHSNVAFFNPNDSYVPVSLELRDANGNVTGTRTLTLAPNQMMQLPLSGSSGLFNNISGNVDTSSLFFLSGQPILAIGSVVDDTSGDSTIIEAESDETETD